VKRREEVVVVVVVPTLLPFWMALIVNGAFVGSWVGRKLSSLVWLLDDGSSLFDDFASDGLDDDEPSNSDFVDGGFEADDFDNDKLLDDGRLDGPKLSSSEGCCDGRPLGITVGTPLDIPLGTPEGSPLGIPVGTPLGIKLGVQLGAPLGIILGFPLGTPLGIELGTPLGIPLGTLLAEGNADIVGAKLGPFETCAGQNSPRWSSTLPIRFHEYTSPSVTVAP